MEEPETDLPTPPQESPTTHVPPTQARIIANKRSLASPYPINNFLIVMIVILLAISGFLGWQYFSLLTSPLPTTTSYTAPNPSPSPQDPKSEWNKYYIDDLGLSYLAPDFLTVNLQEPNPGAFTLYIENGKTKFDCEENDEECYYQLYLTYQLSYSYTEEDLENVKTDLIDESIVDTEIDSYPAIQGQVKGERNRFVTYILFKDTLISVWTSQPTEHNRRLTNSILSTFMFTPNPSSDIDLPNQEMTKQ